MDDRERALAECLDVMADGGDAAAIVAAHPALAAELRALLDLADGLARLPAQPGPTPAFRARLAAALAQAPAPARLNAAPLPTTLVVQALDEALACLDRGQAVSAIVAGLPAGAGELQSLVPLAAALEQLPQPQPSSAFRSALADRLASAPAPSSLASRPSRGALVALVGRFWASTAASAAVAATVVLCAGAGLGFAARDALPGAALYPIKLGTERLEVWLSGDVHATAIHLDHARRRLDEAVRVPDRAVESLGRFNRDVTAALGGADAALAAGASRERVAMPLVAWLGTARHDLITAQDRLPVAAWRAARAVLDEGIVAFRGAGGLAERPVPRLAPGAEVLAARAAASHPWSGRVVLAPLRPSPGRGAAPAPEPEPAPERPAPPVVQVAAAAPSVGEPAPGAQIAPAPAVPTDPPARATDRPRPTDRPAPQPTATPEPTEPPVVPTEPTAEPTAPPPDPTEPPAPTPTPGAPQPTVLELRCTPDPVKSAGTAECQVTNLEGEAVEIEWSVSMGRMEPSEGDARSARFVDIGGISGVSRLFVTVTAVLVPGPAWDGGEPPAGQVVIVVEPEHGVAP